MDEPIVIIPGMMCDSNAFTPQIQCFSQKRMVIIAPPTQGESIRDMAALIGEHLPKRFALVGHGMGGMVAQEIARRLPSATTRLALISTTPLPETPEQACWREPQIVRAKAGRLREAIAELVPSDSLAPGAARQQILELLGQMAEGFGAEQFIRQSRALQRRSDSQRSLQRLKLPVLVLCGAFDQIFPPKRHEAMASLMPKSELVILPNAGHMPMLESPDLVNIALQAWLDIPVDHS